MEFGDFTWYRMEAPRTFEQIAMWIGADFVVYTSVGDDLICLGIQSYSKATTSMANAFQQHPSQVNDMFLKFFLSF